MEKTEIFISVIICTYRRPDYLRQELNSLIQQDWQEGGWEIIVIENDVSPSSEINGILNEYSKKLPLRGFFLEKPNLSIARNLGAKVAQGTYAAYLDDDVVADPSWLKAVIEGCKKYKPDFCGGPSLPLYISKKPVWFKDKYGTANYYGKEPRLLGSEEYLSGMNFVILRELILMLGGFREDLGMTEDKLKWGDDTELVIRARKHNPNLKVEYLPEAIVFHVVRPEKMTISWQFKSYYTRFLSSIVRDNLEFSRLKALKKIISTFLYIIIKTPGLFIVIFLDLFRPRKRLFKRYLRDNMLNHIAKIALLSQYVFYNKLLRKSVEHE